MQVSIYPCLVKQMDNPGRGYIYLLLINIQKLINIEEWHLVKFEPTHFWVNHNYEVEAKVLLQYSTEQFILYYQIFILTYQLYMHVVTKIQLFNYIGYQMSIAPLTLLEKFTYLVRINIHLCLRDNYFKVTNIIEFVCKSTTNRVIYIEMITI